MAHYRASFVAILALAAVAVLTLAGGVAAHNKGKKHGAAGAPVVACYVGTWANYRAGNGTFKIEDVNAKLCTHVLYAFAGITADGNVVSLDTWLDLPGGLNGYKRMVNLKKSNPALKVLLSVGGWNQGSTNFSKVANNATLRTTFAKNAVKFLCQYGFDGMDMDWEYPTQRGGAASDKAAFVLLLKAMRAEFAVHKLLLTAALPVGQSTVDTGYDVPGLMKYLDLAFLMAYDLHISSEAKTGMNAATRAGRGENDGLNVISAVKLWLARGGVPSKMVLGLPMYGHSFTLSDASNAVVGAPSSGPGTAGPYTKEAGTLSFLEICEKQKTGQFPEKWDADREVPYAVQGNQWVSYDNVRSFKIKSTSVVRQYGLAGVMMWSLESDDFKNSCGLPGGAYPLLRAAYGSLYGNNQGGSKVAAQ